MQKIEHSSQASYAWTMRSAAAVAMIALAIAGCMDNQGVTPDAPLPPSVDVPPGCPALPEASTFDFDLGQCTADSNPQVNVVCGADDRGWCVAGTCRPAAYALNDGCPLCPAGTMRYTTGEAAYCAAAP